MLTNGGNAELKNEVSAVAARMPRTQSASFAARDVLYEPGRPAGQIFFLSSGVVSLANVSSEGGLEVATAGRGGVAGFEPLFGIQVTTQRCVAVTPGEALRMDASHFMQAFHSDISFRTRILGHVSDRMRESAQLAICNRLHSIEQRLARWFLVVSERGGTNHISVTHDELSQMLGSRRSTVTLTTGVLQSGGMIRYRRGNLDVLDRAGLERVACHCYQIILGQRNKEAGGRMGSQDGGLRNPMQTDGGSRTMIG
jgi:CRP-like cAMP-binding protein